MKKVIDKHANTEPAEPKHSTINSAKPAWAGGSGASAG